MKMITLYRYINTLLPTGYILITYTKPPIAVHGGHFFVSNILLLLLFILSSPVLGSSKSHNGLFELFPLYMFCALYCPKLLKEMVINVSTNIYRTEAALEF